ncbi:MAG: FtsX-like permease family protein [Andreesenia angusta]|nr:FtsX-like permease family protein [Andreesenia angusta]
MKEAIRKDRMIEAIKTKTRFLSILCLIALGVFVYTGLKATGINIRETLENYCEYYNMPDITIRSTLGIDEVDEKIINNTRNLERVEYGYISDYILDNDRNIIRLQSESSDLALYKLLEGKALKEPNDILLDIKLKKKGYDIGQELEVKSEENQTDSLKTKKFNIVGFVKSPEYLSKEDRGKTNIGSGDILGFGIIKDENFNLPFYTIARLKYKDIGDLKSYSKEYEDKVSEYADELRKRFENRSENRLSTFINEAELEIEEAENELKAAREELDRGKNELENAKKDIEEGKERLYTENAEANLKFIEGKEKLLEGENKIKDAKIRLDTGNLLKNFGDNKLFRMEKELNSSQDSLEKARKKLDKLSSDIYDLESLEDLNSNQKEILNSKKYKYNLLLSDYNKIRARVDEIKKEIDMNRKTILESNFELDSGLNDVNSAENILNQEKKKYQEAKLKAKIELNRAKDEIESGEKKYQRGLKEYDDKKVEAEEKIESGEIEIEEAKEEIKKIKKPKYFINSKIDDPNYNYILTSSRNIDSLSNIFPVFFFAIAILVSLTTMTRMVDEQRSFMGTMKALGYSNRDIIKKFTHYGLFSAIIGIIIGSTFGTTVLSKVIFDAYMAPQDIGDIAIKIHYKDIVIASLISLLSTAGAAYWVSIKDLKENAASLMRPKAPEIGSRIFLERFKFIWKRLTFIQKVTARNIFRYKKRMLMTVFGVAGCTALIFMGIGIKNSLSGIEEKQYEELFKFDAIIAYNLEDYPKDKYENAIDDVENVKESLKVNYKSGNIDSPLLKYENAILLSTDSKEEFSKFIKLRNRKTLENYELNDYGVYIGEKIAKVENIKNGDYIKFKDEDNKIYNLKVSGITENYAGQYIYMTDNYYNKIFNDKYNNNSYLIKAKNNGNKAMEEMSKEIMENKATMAIISTNYIRNIISDMEDSIDAIVLVILACGSLLAIVVLYNLTNINVSERERELSTIKVLGFYNKEVTAYVYRETLLLTIMGIALGLFIGIFLHRYVLLSVEPPSVMMDPETRWYNYLISSIVTLIISIGVLFIIHKKLKAINMIESLKSVE